MSENQKEFQSGAGTLQVRKIGNSIGFILPKDTAARLDLKEGDKLFLLEQPGAE
jgi:putative addiction module antidote